MHKITKEFLDNIEQEKTQGRNFFEYELIEEYRKFYAKWQGRRLEYEYKRKPLRATIYEELSVVKSQITPQESMQIMMDTEVN
jgi:hypothetical protein